MAIKIQSAFYGVQGVGKDVTQIVQNIVKNGNDDVPINNTAMGGDPAPGKQKVFGVLYFLEDGSYRAMTGTEGTILDLVPAHNTVA